MPGTCGWQPLFHFLHLLLHCHCQCSYSNDLCTDSVCYRQGQTWYCQYGSDTLQECHLYVPPVDLHVSLRVQDWCYTFQTSYYPLTSLLLCYRLESVVYFSTRVVQEGTKLEVLEGEMGFVSNPEVHSAFVDDDGMKRPRNLVMLRRKRSWCDGNKVQ